MRKKILNEFNKTDPESWKRKIKDDLNKLGYRKIPEYSSKENIDIKPFYTKEDQINSKNLDLTYPENWRISNTVIVENSSDGNLKACNLIDKGADSINFIIRNREISFKELLKNISSKNIELFLEIESSSAPLLSSLNELAKKSNLFNIVYDPIGNLVKSGNWTKSMNEDLNQLKNNVNLLKNFNNTIVIDSGIYQNAGANIFEEIAFSMNHANEYLNYFNGKNAEKIAFKVSIGSNYFFEIAKLRAMRLLWSNITNEYGNKIISPHIIAKPSNRNKTIYEYNNNILRTTTECLSAIFGGANTISNSTYDYLFNKKNEFSDRIALNQLLIIKNETNIDKVKNAADGSYYIDNLTSTIAEGALKIFKDIEEKGGHIVCLEKNIIQDKIKDSHKIEQKYFDDGKEKLIGINTYKDESLKIKSEITKDISKKTNTIKGIIEPLIESRIAEETELSRINNE